MDNKICVSIIFATYNRASIINQVIEAWRNVDKVTKFTYEIICSDDESKDNTVDLLRSVHDLPITVITNIHGGASKARNSALNIARGEIVIFTGDDIFPEPMFINQHYENYLKYGSKVATLGQLIWHPQIKQNHLMKHITCIGCEQFSFFGMPSYQMVDFRHFYTSNISIARAELDQMSYYFDDSFDRYGFEDIEFGYRLEKNGIRIFYDPSILASHHHIYDSVDKFCNRQLSAGDQLVVFNKLHQDLNDRCGLDINELRNLLIEFLEAQRRITMWGSWKYFVIKSAKSITRLLEVILKRFNSSILKIVCSKLYSRIFTFYLIYGCAKRIIKEESINVCDEYIYQFVDRYIHKDYHQIYFNTGFGFSEEVTLKFLNIGSKDVKIDCVIPPNTQQIRFDALAKPCIIKLVNASSSLPNGEKEDLVVKDSNAKCVNKNMFDFLNTIDPQICFEKVNPQSTEIHIELEICKMKNDSIFKKVHENLYKMKWLFNERRRQKRTVAEWSIQYSDLQPRKIQLRLGGCCANNKNYINSCKDSISIFGEYVVISDRSTSQNGYINYNYFPKEKPLHPKQLVQVIYTLLNFNYEYIIVSNSLDNYPNVNTDHINDALIYMNLLGESISDIDFEVSKGRLMRLPMNGECNNKIDIAETMNIKYIKDDYKLIRSADVTFQLNNRIYNYHKQKPLVFVFPIFMAVGGVEKNTIEIMRELRNDFNFCVFTMERHYQQQGSLHEQLIDICDYIFDLREIAEFEHYLDLINDFKKMFQPDIIWLCNNSPWFEGNSMAIRKIFNNIPVIVQDAYDTVAGWIEYYDTPGMQSYDRYIAINEKIKEVFINKYNIDNSKIDVIYSAVDGNKIEKYQEKIVNKVSIEEKYQLQHGKKHFAYIGRLTEQKNPLRYLKLVKEATVKHSDVEFIMVGDGVLKEDVDRYIIENDLQDSIVRIPYIESTPELISVLDGLVLTSDYEGLAIVSIEAMSVGVPIFSTNTGDLELFLDKTNGGMTIDESSADIDNFDIFYSSLERYRSNALKMKKQILTFFSASTIGNQYRNTFTKAMNEHKKG